SHATTGWLAGFMLHCIITLINDNVNRSRLTETIMTTQHITLAQARAYDKKRYLWPMGFGIILLTAGGALVGYIGGITPLIFAGPIMVYVIVPTLDWLIGKDSTNPPERVLDLLEDDPFYRRSTYIYVLVQLVLFVTVCAIVGTQPLSGWQWLGFVTTLGMMSGISINTAHELGHKKTQLERWLAMIALAPVAYGHFYVEHNKGHHRRVATPEDPASARMGESFWRFLPRTVIGSVRSAWGIEAERLARKGGSVWSLRNEILQAW